MNRWLHAQLPCSFLPISAGPEAGGSAARVVRARQSCFMVLHGPGEFASGLTAEGSGGAAGRRLLPTFLRCRQGKRHNIWCKAPTTSTWGTK
jgi:hypothetical protein